MAATNVHSTPIAVPSPPSPTAETIRDPEPTDRSSRPSTSPATTPTTKPMLTPSRAIPSAQAMRVTKPTALTPAPDLRVIGRTLDDLQHMRIVVGNRIGAAEREIGVPLPHLHATLEPIGQAEMLAERELIAAFRQHPLSAWAKTQLGLGRRPQYQVNLARLLAIIGHHGADREGNSAYDHAPLYAPKPSSLYAYCGHGDPARSIKHKGMTQAELFKAGNPEAKKRVHLIAEAMLKAGNRAAYDAERLRVAEKVHDRRDCPQCKARIGEPWRPGHQHASGLRVLGRTFLHDLWLAANEAT